MESLAVFYSRTGVAPKVGAAIPKHTRAMWKSFSMQENGRDCRVSYDPAARRAKKKLAELQPTNLIRVTTT